MAELAFDYLIIGSGFGGSVAACRLSEKGYRVAVIEQGKRFRTEDFARSTWELRKYLWMPSLGCHGIFAMSVMKDLVVFHGAGVGGGSLGLCQHPPGAARELLPRPQVGGPVRLEGRAGTALSRSQAHARVGRAAAVLRIGRSAAGCAHRHGHRAHVQEAHRRRLFWPAGQSRRPASERSVLWRPGPARTSCTTCGACMVGCRVGAKNTLDKNYLYFAEQRGTQVVAETRVVAVRPLGAADGSEGYEVETECSTSLGGQPRQRFTAKNVIFSAGVMGTVKLLFQCREAGQLPKISAQLGKYVRTNSESITAVVARGRDLSRGVAISSGGHTPDGTHVEIYRYGKNADSMGLLGTVHTSGGKLPRQLYFLAAVARHPLQALRNAVWPFGWSKSMAGVLAMQAVDNSMELTYKRRWYWPFGKSMSSDWGDRPKPPTFLPQAHEVTERLAKRLNAEPGSVVPEVLLDTTTTAHILGGCAMGKSAEDGVIDKDCRVFGYQGLYVVDGSMIGANLGVNPSLTITAMAERAMAQIPARKG
jgi:cholesterol oxidase